jgi:two-component system, cell cycle sensor histidine kinase and response regulator CckA
MNLVVNARDALPSGGHVTISTNTREFDEEAARWHPNRRPGTFVCLSVADTGTGMEPEILARIFEPFFTTKEAGRGTGLGLATVHGIAAQHRGWIEVSSTPGAGTRFEVFLPAVGRPVPDADDAAQPETRGGAETVLVVEDDASVRAMLATALRGLGYRVIESANGQDAVQLWREAGDRVDLLLTDMVMPKGMTGLELSETLHAMKPTLRTIISSGYSAEMVQGGVPTRDGLVYLPKPYSIATLARVVRESLDRG